MDYDKIANLDNNRSDYLKNEKFPPSIAIETTNNCNLNCNYCGHCNMTRSKGFMDIKMYKKVIDEIAIEDLNTSIWLEFYGEPLLLKYKLAYFIRYAKDKKLKNVFINTNGLLLDDEISEAILDSGVDKIVISLDAYYEESYLKNRNNSKFEEVKNNIIKLIDIKNKLKAKTIIEVQLIEIPDLHKKDEIIKFETYWEQKGANVKIKPYITWNGAISIDGLRNNRRYPCGWLFRTFAITWDGKVAQCSCDFDAKYVAGDINENSIKYIWQNNLKKIRDLHLLEEYDKTPICSECKDWDSYHLMDFLKE